MRRLVFLHVFFFQCLGLARCWTTSKAGHSQYHKLNQRGTPLRYKVKAKKWSSTMNKTATDQPISTLSNSRWNKKRSDKTWNNGTNGYMAQIGFTSFSNSRESAYLFNRELQKVVRTGSTRKGQTAAQQAEELLLKRVQNLPDASYDTVSFNIVLQAWANQHTMTAARRADELLSLLLRMTNTSTSTGSRTTCFPIQADAYSYAAVLHAYAKSGGKLKAAQRAAELLEQLERSNRGISTDVCHNAVMNAWAVSGSPKAGERAERILRQLMGNKNITPTRIAFNACIKAYAKAGQPKEAQRLLNQMKSLSQTQPQLTPDKITYSTCIDAWSRSCDTAVAARQAESLLAEMENSYASTGEIQIRPDVVSYTSVLAAYAKSGEGINHSKAQELLERMRAHAQVQPNAAFLNAWIHLLAKASASRNALEAETHEAAAEEILQFMRIEYAQGNVSVKPCKITFTAVISVLAQVGTTAAALRAQELLDELQRLWERTRDSDYLPNAKTFASVINAWGKSGSARATEAADQLVHRMEELYKLTCSEELEPNLIVFLQVFRVLANSRDSDAALKAKKLLKKMHALQLGGFPAVRPDATTYAYLINTFTKSKVENVAELASVVLAEAEEGYRAGIGSLKPTDMLYSAVLQAYAKSSSKEGAQLAEDLLERTKDLYRKGKLYAKPTTLFYNAVIDAHARSGGGRAAAERAEELLEELEAWGRAGDSALKPKTRTFNAAILAWKNSGDPDAPRRAEALLRRMNETYKAGDMDYRPDRVTLNSIIGAWANSQEENAAERAEEFLRFMEATCTTGDVSLKPDAWTFNSCIAAYTKKNALQQAQRLYERMKKLYESGDVELRPDLITLMLLRRAWAHSNDKMAPVELSRIKQDIARFSQHDPPELRR